MTYRSRLALFIELALGALCAALQQRGLLIVVVVFCVGFFHLESAWAANDAPMIHSSTQVELDGVKLGESGHLVRDLLGFPMITLNSNHGRYFGYPILHNTAWLVILVHDGHVASVNEIPMLGNPVRVADGFGVVRGDTIAAVQRRRGDPTVLISSGFLLYGAEDHFSMYGIVNGLVYSVGVTMGETNIPAALIYWEHDGSSLERAIRVPTEKFTPTSELGEVNKVP